MRKLWLSFPALLIALSLLPGQGAIAQDGDSTPHFYYFSSDLKAFVIEDVEGTSRYVIGEGISDPETDTVEITGWSPSGEWFAWRAVITTSYRIVASRAYAVSVNGESGLRSLRDSDGQYMAWSPVDDVLLVVDVEEQPGDVYPPEATMLIQMIDVNADQVLVSLTESMPRTTISHIAWDAEGRVVTIVHEGYTTAYRLQVNAEGVVSSQSWEAETLLFNDDYSQLLYREGDQLLWDMLDGSEPRNFFLPENCPSIRNIAWNGEHALIVCSPEAQAMSGAVWLVDMQRDGNVLLYEDIAPSFLNTWSPDGQHAVFSKPVGELVHIQMDTLEPQVLPVPVYPDVSVDNWRWYDDHHLMLVREDFFSSPDEIVFLDVVTGESFSYTDDMPFALPELSDDQRYLYYVQQGLVIHDFEADTTTRFEPYTGYGNTMEGGFINRHNSGWILVEENALVAGGGLPVSVQIISPEGSQRELTTCGTPDCSAWLPPQVDVSQLQAME